MAGVHQYPNPADHPGAEPFLRGLAESGSDPLVRLQFADWLQGEGYDNAASGQRWAAKYNRKPRPAGNDYITSGWYPHGLFNPEPRSFDKTGNEWLPNVPFDAVSGGEDGPPFVFRNHQEPDPNDRSKVLPTDKDEVAYRHEKDLLANVHHLRWTADNEIDMEPDLKYQDDGPNGNT